MANIISALVTESLKTIPFIGTIISSWEKYQADVKQEQIAEFINEVYIRINNLESNPIKWDFYETIEGKKIAKKIVASAANAEYSDKVQYFANVFVHATFPNISHDEKQKFIEILRLISYPAIKVLANARKIHLKRGQSHSPQVDVGSIVGFSKLNPHIVEACITELYNLGVFSSTIEFDIHGRQLKNYTSGVPAYTAFTERFVQFISTED
ncbi:MAG: hypothetical protein SCALA702_02300 [Melioribacteraceae bacterium]|nr:MAG: hypothetical protein SCALA702_02300 [Melioribacteraceae bacterium]